MVPTRYCTTGQVQQCSSDFAPYLAAVAIASPTTAAVYGALRLSCLQAAAVMQPAITASAAASPAVTAGATAAASVNAAVASVPNLVVRNAGLALCRCKCLAHFSVFSSFGRAVDNAALEIRLRREYMGCKASVQPPRMSLGVVCCF